MGEASQMERAHLLALAKERFPIAEVLFPLIVDNKGRVKVKTNWYSAPVWPGHRVTARVWPSLIEIVHDGECVARHQRNYGRGHQILELEHYLDVLEKNGWFDTAGAVATGQKAARLSGSDLEETRGAPR